MGWWQSAIVNATPILHVGIDRACRSAGVIGVAPVVKGWHLMSTL
jgi:hypothetical protein